MKADVNQVFFTLLSNRIGENLLETGVFRQDKAFALISANAIKDAIKVLLEADENAGLSAITCIDAGENLELMYHIRFYGKIVTIKVKLSKNDLRIKSVTSLMPGADFHEREVADLFGVVFNGHPNPKRLILPDEWPVNLFPLRKDFETAAPSGIKDSSFLNNENLLVENKSIIMNFIVGPQHPALIEPEKFLLRVDGEIVKDVEPRIGYVHRGVEKIAEKRTYLQNIYLVERICGICNAAHAACFCQTVEALLGINVPSRARYLRTLILELNRIHSHMLLLGHACLEIGYETLFQYMWRDREIVMDLVEQITGNRVIASFITIGGVRRDLPEKLISEIKSRLEYLKKRVDFYRNVFEKDSTIKARTKGIGVLSKNDALRLCVVGPVARASGVKIDVRRDDPYAAYDEIPFNIITYDEGDSWARLMVRLDELEESITIINYILDNLPGGPYRVRVPRVVLSGEAVGRVEAPRGELFYYVKSNGTAYPERVKIRTPTFANIFSFAYIMKGGSIADVPAILVSLDPCFSCTDR